jgi:hypothetical protein
MSPPDGVFRLTRFGTSVTVGTVNVVKWVNRLLSRPEVHMRFRRRPIEIEAQQFTDDTSARRIIVWAAGKVRGQYDPTTGSCTGLFVHTLDGTMLADPGDWVIRGALGDYRTCRGEMFESQYEPVPPVEETA